MNFNIWSGIVGVFVGLLGAMGLGGGGILIVYLTLYQNIAQQTAQGINLIFFIPSAMVAVIMHLRKKLICVQAAIFCSVAGVVGAIAGANLASLIDSHLLSKFFAVLLLCIGILQFKKPRSSDRK